MIKLKLKPGNPSSPGNSTSSAANSAPSSSKVNKKKPKIKIKASKFEDGTAGNTKRLSFSSTPIKSKSKPKLKVKLPLPHDVKPSTKSIRIKNPNNVSIKLKPPMKKLLNSNRGVMSIPRIRVKPTRQPGQGYDSEAPDQEDDPLIEEAILFRMKPGPDCDYLRQCTEDGDFRNVNIKFIEQRKAIITIHHNKYIARLMDLPCIIEAHKSLDRKNLFKNADICQVLYVGGIINNEDDEVEINEKFKSDPLTSKDDNLNFQHGLSTPLFNVRKRRFRKRLSNKVIESVEAKVDELFRLDAEAEGSQYELIDPQSLERDSSVMNDDNVEDESETPFDMLGGDMDIDMEVELDNDDFKNIQTPHNTGIDRNSVEVEVNADDIENFGDDIETLGVELEKALEGGDDEDEDDEDDEDDDDDDDDESEDEMDNREGKNMIDEKEQHKKMLLEEITELETKIQEKITDAKSYQNPLLISRFMGVVNKLKQELEMKKRQLKNVEGETNNNDADKEKSPTNDDDLDNDEVDNDEENENQNEHENKIEQANDQTDNPTDEKALEQENENETDKSDGLGIDANRLLEEARNDTELGNNLEDDDDEDDDDEFGELF